MGHILIIECCWLLRGAMSSHTHTRTHSHSTGRDCEALADICLVLLFTQITASGSCLAPLFVIVAVSVLRSFLPSTNCNLIAAVCSLQVAKNPFKTTSFDLPWAEKSEFIEDFIEMWLENCLAVEPELKFALFS